MVVEHLFQHFQQPERVGKDGGSDSDSSTSTDKSCHQVVNSQPKATPPPKVQHQHTRRLAQVGLAVGDIASMVAHKPTAGLPTTMLCPYVSMVFREQALSAPFVECFVGVVTRVNQQLLQVQQFGRPLL